MTTKNQIYKCELCGNIVEVLHDGAGELVCCGQAMKLYSENTVDAVTEKHVPKIEKQADGILVKVGEVNHPMDADHYIEWIELLVDNKIYRQNLKPGDKPEVKFFVQADTVQVRAYCNLHGLWQA